MTNCTNTTNDLTTSSKQIKDSLSEMLRLGAIGLIEQAVALELERLLQSNKDNLLSDGRLAVVRNGYLPQRDVQTGIGNVTVKVPKIHDRSGNGVCFNSALLPPYLKRTKNIDELLPWLYLRGISTGNYQDALAALLGDQAKGLSANTICRLKQGWIDEFGQWSKRDLTGKNYVYMWADGIYCNARQDERICLLVIIGVLACGTKEILAVEDGYRESTASWQELLQSLSDRGLHTAPKLAIGDGAMGFWQALSRVYPSTKHQRCWVHKTANVLNKLPKKMQPKIKDAIHQIWMAEDRQSAYEAFDKLTNQLQAKYPKAEQCLLKDKQELLAFYDFPAQHWQHIRTTNPIESTFATVRLRTKRTRNCGSAKTTLAMVFKLLQTAQKGWKKIKGFNKLTLLVNNVKFKDGIQIEQQSTEDAA